MLWTDFVFFNLCVGNSQRIISYDMKCMCMYVCVFPHFGPGVVLYGAKLLLEGTISY